MAKNNRSIKTYTDCFKRKELYHRVELSARLKFILPRKRVLKQDRKSTNLLSVSSPNRMRDSRSILINMSIFRVCPIEYETWGNLTWRVRFLCVPKRERELLSTLTDMCVFWADRIECDKSFSLDMWDFWACRIEFETWSQSYLTCAFSERAE